MPGLFRLLKLGSLFVYYYEKSGIFDTALNKWPLVPWSNEKRDIIGVSRLIIIGILVLNGAYVCGLR